MSSAFLQLRLASAHFLMQPSHWCRVQGKWEKSSLINTALCLAIPNMMTTMPVSCFPRKTPVNQSTFATSISVKLTSLKPWVSSPVTPPLVNFFDEHNMFNDSQHGFRSSRSCLSQLLAHFEQVTRLLEEGKAVDVVYLDFAKAFDKVDIGITLRKLKSLGIQGQLGKWLFSFLKGRTQCACGWKKVPSKSCTIRSASRISAGTSLIPHPNWRH